MDHFVAFSLIDDDDVGIQEQAFHVVRHLALPIEGKIPERIFAEMDDMDAEMGVRADWEGGKLSGAVYRKSTCFNISTCILTITH